MSMTTMRTSEENVGRRILEELYIRNSKELKEFWRSILPGFLRVVEPQESGFMDVLYASDLLTDTDLESLSGKHVPTRKDQARKLWCILSQLSVDDFVTKVAPDFCDRYYHIIPEKFWVTPEKRQQMITDHVQEEFCQRHAIEKRVRLSTIADVLCHHDLLSFEDYGEIANYSPLRHGTPEMWDKAFRSFASTPGVRTSEQLETDVRKMIESYKVSISSDFHDIMSRGFPCTCTRKPVAPPTAPAQRVERVLSWLQKRMGSNRFIRRSPDSTIRDSDLSTYSPSSTLRGFSDADNESLHSDETATMFEESANGQQVIRTSEEATRVNHTVICKETTKDSQTTKDSHTTIDGQTTKLREQSEQCQTYNLHQSRDASGKQKGKLGEDSTQFKEEAECCQATRLVQEPVDHTQAIKTFDCSHSTCTLHMIDMEGKSYSVMEECKSMKEEQIVQMIKEEKETANGHTSLNETEKIKLNRYDSQTHCTTAREDIEMTSLQNPKWQQMELRQSAEEVKKHLITHCYEDRQTSANFDEKEDDVDNNNPQPSASLKSVISGEIQTKLDTKEAMSLNDSDRASPLNMQNASCILDMRQATINTTENTPHFVDSLIIKIFIFCCLGWFLFLMYVAEISYLFFLLGYYRFALELIIGNFTCVFVSVSTTLVILHSNK